MKTKIVAKKRKKKVAEAHARATINGDFFEATGSMESVFFKLKTAVSKALAQQLDSAIVGKTHGK